LHIVRIFCAGRSERDAFRTRAAIGYWPRLGRFDFPEDGAPPIPVAPQGCVSGAMQLEAQRSFRPLTIKVKVARF
jgi:hypothetical protein